MDREIDSIQDVRNTFKRCELEMQVFELHQNAARAQELTPHLGIENIAQAIA